MFHREREMSPSPDETGVTDAIHVARRRDMSALNHLGSEIQRRSDSRRWMVTQIAAEEPNPSARFGHIVLHGRRSTAFTSRWTRPDAMHGGKSARRLSYTTRGNHRMR